MEPQKPGNSPAPGPEVVKRQKVAKERAAQRIRSWTVPNEMRSVLVWGSSFLYLCCCLVLVEFPQHV